MALDLPLAKVLIANRGEIAVRVIAACRELGIPTVAVHSDVDRDCLHVKMADQSVCIGGPKPAESYLNITAVIAAAEITGADSIHPGYGFLAENAHFADIVSECGLTFIGPPADAIRLMGNKAEARKAVRAAGVPIVPGSEELLRSRHEALEVGAEIGYPVMLKASAGGGGRGMRVAWDEDDLRVAFDTTRTEAEKAFGDPSVYLEKFVERPRHIEFQVLADSRGRCIHLGERECTIQRRHQKLMEEAPSPVLTAEQRAEMGSAAVAATKAAHYLGAGTVEFLLAEDGGFYFCEMNTRIQVEHTITEMVTGVDLVKEQLLIAGGRPMTVPKRRSAKAQGHAIEFRINAEDPDTFAPSPGRVDRVILPGGPGVRVDTHVYEGYVIPPFYDSLIAKLVVHGRDRDEARARGRRALEMMRIGGVKTTAPMHLRVLADPDFVAGSFSTDFMERFQG